MKKSNANRVMNMVKDKRRERLNYGPSNDIENKSCGTCARWVRYVGITTNMSHCRYLGHCSWSQYSCDAFENQGE